MARTVVRRRKGGLTNTALMTWVQQHLDAKRRAKEASAVANELRDRMMEALLEHGYEDDKGHRWIDLPEVIDGCSKIKREKRVSEGVNTERALELLQSKGGKGKDSLFERCTRVVRVLDEEELLKAVYEGDITQDEFKSLIDRSESYAFKTVA